MITDSPFFTATTSPTCSREQSADRIVTDEGIVIRIDMSQISTLSRVTQGVRLINLRDGQFVSTVAIIEKDDSTDSSDDISTEDIVENSNNSDIVDSNTL